MHPDMLQANLDVTQDHGSRRETLRQTVNTLVVLDGLTNDCMRGYHGVPSGENHDDDDNDGRNLDGGHFS